MSLCFQSFNYASNIKFCQSKHTSQSQGKKNPSLVKIPTENPTSTSFFNKPASDTSFDIPTITQGDGIGIIGGVSTDSTLRFAKRLKSLQLEEGSSPPFILCSDPPLSKDLSFFSGRVEADYTSVVENLRRKRAVLEKAGVCCVVMPCHISHSWHDEIKEGYSIPFLHVGECVAKELKAAKLKPLETGSSLRIGVLATNESAVPRIYQEKLEKEWLMQGFEVVLLDKATVEHTMIPALEALNRKDLEGAQNLFRIALQFLVMRGVNRVVLASDHLEQLLPLSDPLWRKCIDPMDALARWSLTYARSAETGK